jgi:hypothetical protein
MYRHKAAWPIRWSRFGIIMNRRFRPGSMPPEDAVHQLPGIESIVVGEDRDGLGIDIGAASARRAGGRLRMRVTPVTSATVRG